MSDGVLGAIIGAIGGVVAAVVAGLLGLLPFLLDDGSPDKIVIETSPGGKSIELTFKDLPPPTDSVAEILNTIDEVDARRIVEFALVGRNNLGLTNVCLYDEDDENELSAYQRLADLGLGVVEVRESPPARPVTVQADGRDENGDWWATVTIEMLDTMCADVSICRRSFSFVPSDRGVEVRTYLRGLLASQLGNGEEAKT